MKTRTITAGGQDFTVPMDATDAEITAFLDDYFAEADTGLYGATKAGLADLGGMIASTADTLLDSPDQKGRLGIGEDIQFNVDEANPIKSFLRENITTPAMEYFDEVGQNYVPTVDNVRNIEDVGDAASWAGEATVRAIPRMVAIAGTGAVGVGASITDYARDIYDKQDDEDKNILKAAFFGTASAAAERVGIGATLAAPVRGGIAKTAGDVLKRATTEGATEVAQSNIETLGSTDLGSMEDIQKNLGELDNLNTFATGAVVGAAGRPASKVLMNPVQSAAVPLKLMTAFSFDPTAPTSSSKIHDLHAAEFYQPTTPEDTQETRMEKFARFTELHSEYLQNKPEELAGFRGVNSNDPAALEAAFNDAEYQQAFAKLDRDTKTEAIKTENIGKFMSRWKENSMAALKDYSESSEPTLRSLGRDLMSVTSPVTHLWRVRKAATGKIFEAAQQAKNISDEAELRTGKNSGITQRDWDQTHLHMFDVAAQSLNDRIKELAETDPNLDDMARFEKAYKETSTKVRAFRSKMVGADAETDSKASDFLADDVLKALKGLGINHLNQPSQYQAYMDSLESEAAYALAKGVWAMGKPLASAVTAAAWNTMLESLPSGQIAKSLLKGLRLRKGYGLTDKNVGEIGDGMKQLGDMMRGRISLVDVVMSRARPPKHADLSTHMSRFDALLKLPEYNGDYRAVSDKLLSEYNPFDAANIETRKANEAAIAEEEAQMAAELEAELAAKGVVNPNPVVSELDSYVEQENRKANLDRFTSILSTRVREDARTPEAPAVIEARKARTAQRLAEKLAAKKATKQTANVVDVVAEEAAVASPEEAELIQEAAEEIKTEEKQAENEVLNAKNEEKTPSGSNSSNSEKVAASATQENQKTEKVVPEATVPENTPPTPPTPPSDGEPLSKYKATVQRTEDFTRDAQTPRKKQNVKSDPNPVPLESEIAGLQALLAQIEALKLERDVGKTHAPATLNFMKQEARYSKELSKAQAKLVSGKYSVANSTDQQKLMEGNMEAAKVIQSIMKGKNFVKSRKAWLAEQTPEVQARLLALPLPELNLYVATQLYREGRRSK